MAAVIMRFVPVILMMMALFLSMMMVMLLIIGNMARIPVEIDYGVKTGYPAAPFSDKIQRPAVKVEFGEFGLEIFGINAEIDERAQGHIPGNTGETVKMQCFHL
jgi:hypothetical protein